MASLYDELGVDASADQEELRRAYRQRARARHPDVSGSPEDDAGMRRLNAAWAVLGDPEARRRYDEELRAAAPPPMARAAPAAAPPRSEEHLAASFGCLPAIRPSFIVLAVLFVIFVVTAYAVHPGSSPGGSSPATSPATDGSPAIPAAALVGSCIRDGADSVLIVACSQRPNSLVIATMPSSGHCPTGTSGYLVTGQTEMVCAQPNGP